jgi:hypothetical protein
MRSPCSNCGRAVAAVVILVVIVVDAHCEFTPDANGSVVIPDNVNSIDGGAFDGCQALVFLVIPDTVSTISAGAFTDCQSLQWAYVAS